MPSAQAEGMEEERLLHPATPLLWGREAMGTAHRIEEAAATDPLQDRQEGAAMAEVAAAEAHHTPHALRHHPLHDNLADLARPRLTAAAEEEEEEEERTRIPCLVDAPLSPRYHHCCPTTHDSTLSTTARQYLRGTATSTLSWIGSMTWTYSRQ